MEIYEYLQDDVDRSEYIVKNKMAKHICDLSDNHFTHTPADHSKFQIEDAEIEEGLFKCPKCKSKKTTYYSVQLRSSDEPMTNFITCTQCKNRWKN